MKHFLLFVTISMTLVGFAANGDTIKVQTHTNVLIQTDPSVGSTSYPSWGVFPNNSVPYRKIIATLKLARPDGLRCGEWDYLNHIRIKRKGSSTSPPLNIEMIRPITPYGWNFGTGWNFTWYQDITEFAQYLHDSVEIEYQHSGYEARADRGWLVTLTFNIIEGTPIMEPVGDTLIYQGHYPYGKDTDPIENYLVPVNFTTPASTKNIRLLTLHTGHGMDSRQNCSEFCKKWRDIFYNGSPVDHTDRWLLCGDLPLFPQAGTWVYDRANWCPGDLTPQHRVNVLNTTTNSHSFEMNMEYYTGGNGNEVITSRAFFYKDIRAVNDASIEAVKRPNTADVYNRMNPICSNPVVTIRNNGKEYLTKAEIVYGIEGNPQFVYYWRGALGPHESQDITLNNLVLPTSSNNIFKAFIRYPNGKPDEYTLDDTVYTYAKVPVVYPDKIVVQMLTNNDSTETTYTIKNDLGEIVMMRDKDKYVVKRPWFVYDTINTPLRKAKTYKDSVELEAGCYVLEVNDKGGDGLDFWANRATAGSGNIRVNNWSGSTIINYGGDWGSIIQQSFLVGTPTYREQNSIRNIEINTLPFNLVPNPTKDGLFEVFFSEGSKSFVHVEITDVSGKVVFSKEIETENNNKIPLQLNNQQSGIYFVTISSGVQKSTQKLILTR